MVRRHDSALLLAGLGLAAAGAYLAPSITAGLPSLRPLLGIRDRLADGVGVALTFDDGPHPEGTPAVLEALAAAGAEATFFLVGEQVERWPAVVADLAAAGHEVGIHCYRHRSLLRLTPTQVGDDLRRAAGVIEEASGRRPRFYRPPYGVLNAAALRHARRQGWQTVLWRRDGRDWQQAATPSSIASRLTNGVRAGDILLLHDSDAYSAPGSWRRTAAALPFVFAALERRGLAPRPLGSSRAERFTRRTAGVEHATRVSSRFPVPIHPASSEAELLR
jgi:peptidoglycan/xylan/chitin deacetylase (PgdA/CDA1 family)